MPYPKDHKQRTHRKILASAQRLFCAGGFEATSIEQVMSGCDLTRGAFYAHFRSKAHLYEEAMGLDAAREATGEWLDTLFTRMPGGAAPAPWGFLAADVASREPGVRSAYAHALDQLRTRLRQHAGANAAGESAALASAAMVVGAMAVGASVDDSVLTVRMAQACSERAREILQGSTAREPAFLWAVNTP